MIIAVLLGLLVNEGCELSPWLALRLVRLSARLRYGKTSRAEVRAEEWSAYVNDRPGKLFKLFTAVGFFAGAVRTAAKRKAVTAASAIRATGADRYRRLTSASLVALRPLLNKYYARAAVTLAADAMAQGRSRLFFTFEKSGADEYLLKMTVRQPGSIEKSVTVRQRGSIPHLDLTRFHLPGVVAGERSTVSVRVDEPERISRSARLRRSLRRRRPRCYLRGAELVIRNHDFVQLGDDSHLRIRINRSGSPATK
ncbi:hypothetical protein [Paractinoplanes deccanensis]|uniref:hypothetical protein n=1 Tax=Paractinoplanes deccanensis TaxID=113561 RepID=UPI0019447DF6|nr:hypothetical protein [Actinoplanes deccanensis]